MRVAPLAAWAPIRGKRRIWPLARRVDGYTPESISRRVKAWRFELPKLVRSRSPERLTPLARFAGGAGAGTVRRWC